MNWGEARFHQLLEQFLLDWNRASNDRTLNDTEIDALTPGSRTDGIPNCALTRLTHDTEWHVESVAAADLSGARDERTGDSA